MSRALTLVPANNDSLKHYFHIDYFFMPLVRQLLSSCNGRALLPHTSTATRMSRRHRSRRPDSDPRRRLGDDHESNDGLPLENERARWRARARHAIETAEDL